MKNLQVCPADHSPQLVNLKQQADLLLAKIGNFDCILQQKLTKFQISILTKFNKSFASQYTILYKSYMIVVAFTLTLICNILWLKYESINSHVYSNQSQTFCRVEISSNTNDWLSNLAMVLPLKGKFSLVFFQLMLLTSIQIIYQTLIQLHYRLNKKITKLSIFKNEQTQASENVHNSKKTSANQSQNKQFSSNKKAQRVYRQQADQSTCIHCNSNGQIITPALDYWEQNQIIKSLFSIFSRLNYKKNRFLNDQLPANFLTNEFTVHSHLFSTKFLYIFALMYGQNFLWQGIIIKMWKKNTIHIVILFNCVVEFIIWILINFSMQAKSNILFGDNQIIEISSHGEILLGMY